MNDNMSDGLRLENQLCFPLYACSKELIRKYKPYLDQLDLTYTQYITMLVLWQNGRQNVKDLGKVLLLDSGTLTPVLKKLESKGFIKRARSTEDERSLIVTITEKGEALKDKAASVPASIAKGITLEPEEAKCLHRLLYKVLDSLQHA